MKKGRTVRHSTRYLPPSVLKDLPRRGGFIVDFKDVGGQLVDATFKDAEGEHTVLDALTDQSKERVDGET